MKTTFLALIALFSSAAALADYDFADHCNDCMVPRVACRQAGNTDSGYVISITSGGFAGITMASLSEESIAGGRELAKVMVEIKTEQPGLISYNGRAFRLLINGAEQANGYAPARVQALVDGHLIREELICRQL